MFLEPIYKANESFDNIFLSCDSISIFSSNREVIIINITYRYFLDKYDFVNGISNIVYNVQYDDKKEPIGMTTPTLRFQTVVLPIFKIFWNLLYINWLNFSHIYKNALGKNWGFSDAFLC